VYEANFHLTLYTRWSVEEAETKRGKHDRNIVFSRITRYCSLTYISTNFTIRLCLWYCL